MVDKTITVGGQTCTVHDNGDGYYSGFSTAAGNQGVDYKSSPTVISFDKPIGPIDKVEVAVLYQAVKDKLPPDTLP